MRPRQITRMWVLPNQIPIEPFLRKVSLQRCNVTCCYVPQNGPGRTLCAYSETWDGQDDKEYYIVTTFSSEDREVSDSLAVSKGVFDSFVGVVGAKVIQKCRCVVPDTYNTYRYFVEIHEGALAGLRLVRRTSNYNKGEVAQLDYQLPNNELFKGAVDVTGLTQFEEANLAKGASTRTLFQSVDALRRFPQANL